MATDGKPPAATKADPEELDAGDFQEAMNLAKEKLGGLQEAAASALGSLQESIGQRDPKAAQEDPEIADLQDAAAKSVGEAKEALAPAKGATTKFSVRLPPLEAYGGVGVLATLLKDRLLPTAHALPREDTSAGEEFDKAGKHVKRSAQHTGSALSKLGDEAADKAQSGANYVGDKLRGAEQATREAADDAKQSGEEAYYKAKDKLSDAADGAKRDIEEGKAEARGLFGSIRDFFVGVKEDAQDAAHQAARSGNTRPDRSLDEVEDKAQRVGQGLRDYGRDVKDRALREDRANIDNSLDEIEDKARRVGAGLRSYGNEAKEAALDAFDRTRDYFAEAGEEAKGAARRGKEEARGAGGRARGQAESAYDRTANYLQDTRESLEGSWQDGKRRVREELEDARDYVQDTAQGVRDRFVEAAEAAQPKTYWDYMKGQGVPPSDSATEFAKLAAAKRR